MTLRNSKGQFVSRNNYAVEFKDIVNYEYHKQVQFNKEVQELMEIYDIENLCELKELLQGCYIIRRAKERAADRERWAK